MSVKWRETQRWDAEHLTGPLLPVRWVLHAFSSIWLAVILLVLVSMYGALASIPIGLVALIPTWVVIALTAVACVGAGAVIGGTLMGRAVPRTRRGLRFAAMLAAILVGGGLCAWVWWSWVWPALRYDPETGSGLRFFADFVDRYSATTLRRLRGFEMSELEFYSWWPMRLLLVLFVLNLAVATIRRIEFTFKNIGVLTVHTGIIVIALGSVYYQSLKKEGDTLLRAGMPDASGKPGIGPPVRGFYDNTYVALWVAQNRGGAPVWDPRPLHGVPRYNDYGLNAAPPIADGALVIGPAERVWADPGPPLDLPVPGSSVLDPSTGKPRVDADISMRIVGYAAYAEPAHSTIALEGSALEKIPPDVRTPLRVIELLSRVPDASGVVSNPDKPVFTFSLKPTVPAGRISEGSAIAVEYVIGMPASRRADLLETIPPGSRYALVVEVPGAVDGGGDPVRVVLPAEPGGGEARPVGSTGWKVRVQQVMPQPPFPIITKGYEGASSSMAIVELTPPGGGEPFQRWVYHRFGEIDQDLHPGAGGRPARTDADPAIRVSLIDASKLQLYFDEQKDGRIDLIVREPGGGARVIEGIGVGDRIADVVDKIDFRVAGAYAHAVDFEHPVPVPEAERNKKEVGMHTRSLLGVEVSADDPAGGRFTTVVWVPFVQYLGLDSDMQREVVLPGGRRLTLQFGRVWHPFPTFALQLKDFEMIAYDHRGAPRDYQSVVRVSPTVQNADFEAFEHVVKLNAPLRAPYMWSDKRSWLSNMVVRLVNGLNPNEFKLSQSGWDRDGWMQTQQMVDAGQLKRPFARYTILQVGNNPGIHVIALGGVLMAIGIPWAFYVKPWLVKREKRRLAAAHAGKKQKKQPSPGGGGRGKDQA